MPSRANLIAGVVLFLMAGAAALAMGWAAAGAMSAFILTGLPQ